jgi:hypothetical protein
MTVMQETQRIEQKQTKRTKDLEWGRERIHNWEGTTPFGLQVRNLLPVPFLFPPLFPSFPSVNVSNPPVLNARNFSGLRQPHALRAAAAYNSFTNPLPAPDALVAWAMLKLFP